MPSIIELGLIHKAIYWPPAVADNGTPGALAGDPEEIKCRWSSGLMQRIQEDTSIILVGKDVETGGFLLKVENGIEDLLPSAGEQYPSEIPSAGTPVQRWAFNDSLTSDEGNELTESGDSVAYVSGVNNGEAIDNTGNASTTTLTSGSNIEWDGATDAVVSFWIKVTDLDESSPSTDAFATLSIGGLTIELAIDQITVNSAVWDDIEWGEDWVNVQIASTDSEDLELRMGSILQTATTTDVSPTLSDGILTIDLDPSTGYGISMDELLFYNDAVDSESAQYLAEASPFFYIESKSIIDFYAADSLRGNERVRKVKLKGAVE